jgi:hypothetical protein
MVLRAKNVTIEGNAATALRSALSELSVVSRGLSLERIKRIIDGASLGVGAAIQLGFSVQEKYANGLRNPVPQFDDREFLTTLINEVSPRMPAVVPAFLNADGLGHTVVVDKVYRDLGSGEFFVSLRDPATGTRHVPPWNEFAEAAASAVMRAGVILTSVR